MTCNQSNLFWLFSNLGLRRLAEPIPLQAWPPVFHTKRPVKCLAQGHKKRTCRLVLHNLPKLIIKRLSRPFIIAPKAVLLSCFKPWLNFRPNHSFCVKLHTFQYFGESKLCKYQYDYAHRRIVVCITKFDCQSVGEEWAASNTLQFNIKRDIQ